MNSDISKEPLSIAIIGLDGMDWQLLRPWIEQGELPIFAKLINEGSSGILRSTIRPESSIAWSSFITGVNPGKHGVFGFANRSRKVSYDFDLTNAASIGSPPFWHYLNKAGIGVGLLQLPYTFPPSSLDGYMVTGMLTPGVNSNFTFPSSLRHEVLSNFPNFTPDIESVNPDRNELIKTVKEFTEQQLNLALYLINNHPQPVFSMVFIGPDRLQHFLWSCMSPDHPLHDKREALLYEGAILEHYKYLDKAIGRIIDALPPKTTFLFLSDHGFNGCARKFYVNHWLHKNKWLTLAPTKSLWLKSQRLAESLHSFAILRYLKQSIAPNAAKINTLRSKVFSTSIQWSNTKVFFGLDGGLHVNLKGRFPLGIVEPGEEYEQICNELVSQLSVMIDPATKKTIFDRVYRRESLYHGTYLPFAPDIILEPCRSALDAGENYILDSSISLSTINNEFGSSVPYSGNHTLDGIICCWGPHIIHNLKLNANILDLAPTVLALCNCPIPDYMDGQVLPLFDSSLKFQNTSADPSSVPTLNLNTLTQSEQEMIENRLKALGYL